MTYVEREEREREGGRTKEILELCRRLTFVMFLTPFLSSNPLAVFLSVREKRQSSVSSGG